MGIVAERLDIKLFYTVEMMHLECWEYLLDRSQNLQNCNATYADPFTYSPAAFLMIHGPRSKRILNKQMGKLSKTSPASRVPPALLCCAVTHVGEAAPERFIKIHRLVESPGSREAPSGSLLAGAGRDGVRVDPERMRSREGGRAESDARWKWKNKKTERERETGAQLQGETGETKGGLGCG